MSLKQKMQERAYVTDYHACNSRRSNPCGNSNNTNDSSGSKVNPDNNTTSVSESEIKDTTNNNQSMECITNKPTSSDKTK